MSSAKSESTAQVYASSWNIFSSWCFGKGINPMGCTIPEVADLFMHCFMDKKMAPDTVKGYKATIARTWERGGNNSLFHNSVISDLMRSFDLERPRGVRAIPTRNLALVLDALRNTPFELFNYIELGNLAIRTMFLLALSSGNRRSEFHALVNRAVA